MANKLNPGDIKRLLGLQKETASYIKQINESEARFRSEITDKAAKMTARITMEILLTVPIEELNRDKKGIRVKLLRDEGYNTVGDVIRVNERTLTAISGIGPDGAKEIRQAASELTRIAASGAKIRLSTDDKNPQSTDLVTALCKYKRSMKYYKKAESFESNYGYTVRSAVQDLEPVAGRLKWLFASADKKSAAVSAYEALSAVITDQVAESFRSDTRNLLRSMTVTSSEAWSDFAADSISYINILEAVVPDAVGSGGEIYGLPEDVAQSVSEVKLDLTGLRCTLRRYQEWGVKYTVAQRRVLLGDEMGLGKTVQAIAAMVHLRNKGGTHFAVVCPASVLTNWCREIAKHSDLSVIKVHGGSKEAAVGEWLSKGGVAVTTYETTSVFELADDFRITLMTVDEAHYIKNPGAQRTVNAKKLCAYADRLLFMTGTALENRVEEMASLIGVLNPSVASDISGKLSLSKAEQFREAVAPVYYRRKREDVLTELPELIESKEWCDLTPAEKKVYRESLMTKDFTTVRRVSWNVDDLSQSSKAQRLLELVEEAGEQGRKILIFSFFLDTVDKVISLLGDKCIGPINGSVSPERRQEIIDRFDKAPEGTALVAQIQSGGTGLNIQSASVVILCEPQLKPSIENQAVSRAYRMGQTRSVLVYRLLCDDTIDERIVNILAEKQGEFDAFANDSVAANDTSELDEAQLEGLIEEEKDFQHIA